MKTLFLVIAILFIAIPSFAQRQINPTPGQQFWLEQRGMIQLTEKLGKPIDESCTPTFEARCTGMITDLAIFSEDGGNTISSSPRRMSMAKLIIISKTGFAYEVSAKITHLPSSERLLTCGEWVKLKHQNLWKFVYTFQTNDPNDAPVFSDDVTRQISEEAGEEYFVRLR